MASGDRRSLWCCCTARPPGPEHAALWWDGPALPLQGFWTNSTCGQLDGSALASLSQRTQMTPVELRHVEILNTVYCHKLRETFFPPRSLFKTLDSSRKKPSGVTEGAGADGVFSFSFRLFRKKIILRYWILVIVACCSSAADHYSSVSFCNFNLMETNND